MSLHDSPLLNASQMDEWPYRKWAQLSKTSDEFFKLGSSLSGIPRPWMEWVERIVVAREKRGTPIENPLAYRIAILWDGITHLQEVKFVCDTLENALRQLLVAHSQRHCVPWSELRKCIPRSSEISKRIERNGGSNIKDEQIIPISFVLNFTFGETTQLIHKNWDRIAGADKVKPGFKNVFWHRRRLRDANYFLREMNRLKKARNRVAHSNGLFQFQETMGLYILAERWLEVLDMTLSDKIIRYRSKRPRFLENIFK